MIIIPVIVLFISKKKTYLRSKRNVERIYKMKWKMKTKYICDLFPFVIFKMEILTWMFTEQRSPFFIPIIGEMDFFFFSIIILCFIIGYCVISVSKGRNK